MIKKMVFKAYEYSEKKHRRQFRKFSGLPYFSHPKYVARIIEELTNDQEMVSAALLHDVVEDTSSTIEELKALFTERVALLVEELTSKNKSQKDKKIYLAEKMLHMSSEALLIKLVDRYHNVLFLESDNVPKEFIKRYYNETMFILTAIESRDDFNENHETIINAIYSILKFLNIRYKF